MFIKEGERRAGWIGEMREENYRELDWGLSSGVTKALSSVDRKTQISLSMLLRITTCSFLALTNILFIYCIHCVSVFTQSCARSPQINPVNRNALLSWSLSYSEKNNYSGITVNQSAAPSPHCIHLHLLFQK